MRWTFSTSTEPALLSERVRTRFAWYPVRYNVIQSNGRKQSQWLWLERYQVTERYLGMQDGWPVWSTQRKVRYEQR